MKKSSQKASPYRCGFCRKKLNALPFAAADWIGALLLTRPFQCPHCFSVYRRPFAWIGHFPGVSWVSEFIAGNPAKPAGMLKPNDADIAGPATKGFAKLGKWVQKAEAAIGRVFMAIFRIIWFVPGLLLGIKPKKKRRGSSRGKFLK